MRFWRNAAVVLATSALVAGLDQASKWLLLAVVMDPPRLIEVAPVLNLRLGFNTGVSFGLFRETLERWPELLALFKAVVGAGLVVWAVLSRHRLERVGLALLAGGAFGNAIDRWRQGAVTDFLDLHWRGWHWPTFNGADIAITLGVVLIFAAALPAANRASASGATPSA